MITLEELNPRNRELTEEQTANLKRLYMAINLVREVWAKPMIVTSGFRSKEDQMRINPKAPNSKHCLGLAVDISDPSGDLKRFLKGNVQVLVDARLWCEEGTKGWVHFQCEPPRSGKRWFWP